jgi:hypothetical protein
VDGKFMMKTKAAVLYEMGLASPYETSHPLHSAELELSDEINTGFDSLAKAEAVRQLIRF